MEFEMIARDLCGCEGLRLLRFSSTVGKTLSAFFLDLPSSAGRLEHCQLCQLLLIFAWSTGIPHFPVDVLQLHIFPSFLVFSM